MNPHPTLRLPFSQPGRLWHAYTRQLDRAPVATKTATSIVAAMLGDALAQHVARSKAGRGGRYDWGRTARLTAFQGILMGPLGHFYYHALDTALPSSAKSPAAVAAKVVVDQLVFAPLCTIVFYAWKCLSEGRPRALRQELGEKYIPTMVANWKLWPAAHLVNFAFVPPSQRILYANVVSVLGVYILSQAAAGELSGPKLRATAAARPQHAQQAQREHAQFAHAHEQAALQRGAAPGGAGGGGRPPARVPGRMPSRLLQQQEEGGAVPQQEVKAE